MNTNRQHIASSDTEKHALDLHEFRTIEQLVNEFPEIMSRNALQWVLRYRHENGLDQHVAKFGKNILIHLPGFTSWLMKRIS